MGRVRVEVGSHLSEGNAARAVVVKVLKDGRLSFYSFTQLERSGLLRSFVETCLLVVLSCELLILNKRRKKRGGRLQVVSESHFNSTLAKVARRLTGNSRPLVSIVPFNVLHHFCLKQERAWAAKKRGACRT